MISSPAAGARNDPYGGSWYAASVAAPPPSPPLACDLRVDVAIVGGGCTGLSAALRLAERGVRVALLEAGRVGCGASGRNGGQLGSGWRRGQLELQALCGETRARELWEIAEAAKRFVKTEIQRHRIACALTPGIIHAACKRRVFDALRREAQFCADRCGYPHFVELDRRDLERRIATRRYVGAVLDRDAAHLHPLALVFGFARAARAAGAAIYENSPAIALERGDPVRLRTPRAVVVADRLILAGNAYLGDLVPELKSRLMAIHNVILATEPLGKRRAESLIRDDVAVTDGKFIVNYYRLSADRRLLFGGGETWGTHPPRHLIACAAPHLRWTFPQLADIAVDYAWSGRVGVTMRRMPHFGRLDRNVYFAQGYSGHGVAMASFGGALIAEAMLGDPRKFDVIADLQTPRFPGGDVMRYPLHVAAMLWHVLRDRLF